MHGGLQTSLNLLINFPGSCVDLIVVVVLCEIGEDSIQRAVGIASFHLHAEFLLGLGKVVVYAGNFVPTIGVESTLEAIPVTVVLQFFIAQDCVVGVVHTLCVG